MRSISYTLVRFLRKKMANRKYQFKSFRYLQGVESNSVEDELIHQPLTEEREQIHKHLAPRLTSYPRNTNFLKRGTSSARENFACSAAMPPEDRV